MLVKRIRMRTIPYSPLPDITSKIVLAPLPPITLKYKQEEFSTFGLVDSGASGAVMSTVIAEEMGIDWQRVKMNAGFSVGGTFRSHIVENVIFEIFECSFTAKVSIIEGIGPYKCILGQANLFQKAKICFEGYKKQFSIDFREYN